MKPNPNLSMIVAVSDNYGIGKNNALPWGPSKDDMQWFVKNTKAKTILMGSKTWSSLPKKPLPDRVNIVMSTRMTSEGDGCHSVIDLPPEDVSGMISLISKIVGSNFECVVVGGTNVYTSMFPYVSKIYLTRIHQTVDADTFLHIDQMMAESGSEWKKTFIDDSNESLTFEVYERT